MSDTLTESMPDSDNNKSAGEPAGKTGRGAGGALARNAGGRLALVVIWVLMIALFGILKPDLFLTSKEFSSIFSSQQPLIFLSAALLCTIIVGEFVDLSVPSVLALSATLLPVLVVNHHWPLWLGIVAAMAACVLVGIIQGGLIVYMGVNTIVVTLGMSTFLLGIGLLISDNNYVTGLSTSFSKIDLANVFGLPISFYYGILLLLVFAYVLIFTPLGRHMRFVGANHEVSRLAGIRVNRIRFMSFVMAGIIAGAGGIIASAGLGGFDPSVSAEYLLPTFAAVFLGTAAVQPGRFNPLGTLIAIFFLATGISGLELLGAQTWVADVFYGGALVIAVAISTVVQRGLSGR